MIRALAPAAIFARVAATVEPTLAGAARGGGRRHRERRRSIAVAQLIAAGGERLELTTRADEPAVIGALVAVFLDHCLRLDRDDGAGTGGTAGRVQHGVARTARTSREIDVHAQRHAGGNVPRRTTIVQRRVSRDAGRTGIAQRPLFSPTVARRERADRRRSKQREHTASRPASLHVFSSASGSQHACSVAQLRVGAPQPALPLARWKVMLRAESEGLILPHFAKGR